MNVHILNDRESSDAHSLHIKDQPKGTKKKKKKKRTRLYKFPKRYRINVMSFQYSNYSYPVPNTEN